MTPDERSKKIATAVAAAVANPVVPVPIAEGLAAMAEELLALRAWLDILERRLLDR